MRKPTKSSAGASKLPMLLVPMLTILTGCTTIRGAGTDRYIDTSCSAFRPITYSSRDTPETVAEVRAHNRAYDAICPAAD
jgi:hypothetical protein